MKLCSGHLHDLSHAIKHKGLGRFINPERTTEFARKWLNGTASLHEFDPLVVSMLEINAKATQICGTHLINGSCPLCTVERVLAPNPAAETWIDNVSDCMLLFAKVNHLVH